MSNLPVSLSAQTGTSAGLRAEDRVPDWFREALARPGTPRRVEVNGTRLHYLAWGIEHVEKPVLLLLHGFRAHAHWWDGIAPWLADAYRIIAMDFSGMGDSDPRAAYDVDTFAADITGLIDALGIGPVIAVGHSYGGSRLLRACAERPELFLHAVVVDSFVLFKDEPGPRLPRAISGSRVFADFATALTRYRLMPEQPGALPFLVEHIARHSLRQVTDGWCWKFDPNMVPTGYREPDGERLLSRIDTPVDFIRGEHSTVVSVERARRTVQALRNAPPHITIAQGQHHLMLDQPLALTDTIRTLVDDRLRARSLTLLSARRNTR